MPLNVPPTRLAQLITDACESGIGHLQRALDYLDATRAEIARLRANQRTPGFVEVCPDSIVRDVATGRPRCPSLAPHVTGGCHLTPCPIRDAAKETP